MKFAQRIRTLWPWLPAFRAVGETQHLPTAAQQLGVVPSSLSRTVKLVEDEVGIALFDRTTKALVLNEAGRIVLAAVREAMRIVDDALVTAIGDELRGHVGAIATSDLLHAILIPAAARLATAHPALALSTRVAHPDHMATMLLRGDADAAVLATSAPLHADLRAVELGVWTRGVYGSTARAAAIAATSPTSPTPATEYRVVVVGTPDEPVDDGWPASTPRRVVAWAPDERAALELCARGEFVTLAFDALVPACRLTDHVARIALPVSPRSIQLVHRRAVGRHRRTDALVDAIQAAVRDA